MAARKSIPIDADFMEERNQPRNPNGRILDELSPQHKLLYRADVSHLKLCSKMPCPHPPQKGGQLFVPSVVALELWYGVFDSASKQENTKRCETFFAVPVEKPPFQEVDDRFAGELRTEPESIGKPIGAYDLLVAGQAIRHRMIRITVNVSEFSRVKGLVWEDCSSGNPRPAGCEFTQQGIARAAMLRVPQ